MASKRTLFEKIWDAHLVAQPSGRSPIVYIDLHLVHEVTSPQAFDGLRAAGRKVRQPSRAVATVDHNIPTEPRGTPISDLIAAKQIAALQANCKEFGVMLFDMDSPEQGIVHVIGPELGLTQPGMTNVSGDSVPRPAEAEYYDDRGARAIGGRRDGERLGAGNHWTNRDRRRDRARYRIRRRGGAHAFNGRPHDVVQYEHRGRGASRDGGSG